MFNTFGDKSVKERLRDLEGAVSTLQVEKVHLYRRDARGGGLMATLNQYKDATDAHKRWVAEVTDGWEKVITYGLPSQEEAFIECYRWVKRMGWEIDDTEFWYELTMNNKDEADRLWGIIKIIGVK